MSDTKLFQLQGMINNAGISDENIIAGIGIAETGYEKISRNLNITVDEARSLYARLITRLRDEREHLDESESHYGFETDSLGNITLRNSKSGKSLFLRGNSAANLIRRLYSVDEDDHPSIISDYDSLMETADSAWVRQRMDEEIQNQFLEEQNDESEHWAAHQKTGFFGKAGAGCIFLARDTGRVLLAFRSNLVGMGNRWSTFGGAIDSNERPIDTCKREVREEAGFRGRFTIRSLMVYKNLAFRYYNFLAIVDHEFTPVLNWENSSYQWCDYGYWPSPMHFGLKKLLRDPHSTRIIESEITKLSINLDESDDPIQSFEDEINTESGTYNFPWEARSQKGFATARYSGRGEDMQIKVIRITDDRGNPQTVDDQQQLTIYNQAIDYIEHV